MSKFQIILMVVFGFFIIIAVLMFAFYQGGSSNQEATVTIWGDLPAEAFSSILGTVVPVIDKSLSLVYVEKSSETIDKEFTEALASGQGPDLLITSQDRLLKNKSKLMAIPYESVSERDFKEAFVEEGELFMTPEGIYGLPLIVDPLVMYYNRDLLSSAGEAKPMAYWDEIYSLTSKLTKRDAAGNVVQSTVALGETRNINNFKEILSLLMLQAGTPITGYSGAELRPFLTENFGLAVAPSESALDFYTQFSNPTKTYYSWNRSLSEAQTRFTSGDSAYYLGFASELTALRNKNPNLNFGVAPVPQSRVSGRTITYGKVHAVSITRGVRNTGAAFRAALLLVSREVAEPLSYELILPTARRDLLSVKQNDAVISVFFEAALQARGWLDPENVATRNIFRDMIDGVTSGRARTQEAVNVASRALETLMKN
ncbi:MAG: extracellular solute-binding protein [Candidatus Zambryskibacteria bacterium]|nr:extracellular solute-binding protein [Candidatus Zambryskibacteria bacterium]